MTEGQIRQLIQQELAKDKQRNSFNMTTTPSHRHTGKGQDGPQILSSDILPGQRAEGSILMSTQTTYKIGLTFNPTAVWIHGNVTGPSGAKFFVTGNAQLGPSFYLQPGSATSVVTGGPKQSIIQSTTYFGVDLSGGFHTLVDEGHIVDIFYSNTLFVRGTITEFGSNYLTISFTGGTNVLTTGWAVNLSWTVT